MDGLENTHPRDQHRIALATPVQFVEAVLDQV